MKPSIALIGPGKVGCAVTRRLHRSGYPIKAVISRDITRASNGCDFIGCDNNCATIRMDAALAAEIILLAIPDDQLAAVATTLQQSVDLKPGQIMIHFSGLHAAEIMRSGNARIGVLSIHPLLPFASRELASQRLTDCPCALEGDEELIPLGTTLIKAFAGKPFRITTEKKALYHASACIASNFLVSLLATATGLLVECGISTEDALPLLLPLVQASLDNVAGLGLERGLTGPIVRGDQGTVAAHLVSLQSAPAQRALYQLLGNRTIELAKQSHRLSSAQAESLRQLLSSNP